MFPLGRKQTWEITDDGTTTLYILIAILFIWCL